MGTDLRWSRCHLLPSRWRRRSGWWRWVPGLPRRGGAQPPPRGRPWWLRRSSVPRRLWTHQRWGFRQWPPPPCQASRGFAWWRFWCCPSLRGIPKVLNIVVSAVSISMKGGRSCSMRHWSLRHCCTSARRYAKACFCVSIMQFYISF